MRKQAIILSVTALSALPAFAHHPLAGAPMETFSDGLLSGIGHPALGFDHLLFVCAAGIAAAYTKSPKVPLLGYIIAMLAGCLLMANGFELPAKEAIIAMSLLVVGGVVLSGRALGTGAAIGVFALFGLFHGSAFGDSLIGQEGAIGSSVLWGYLIGLGVIQFAVALLAGFAVKKMAEVQLPTAIEARLSGAMVAGAGLLLTLEAAEGALFAAAGWGA